MSLMIDYYHTEENPAKVLEGTTEKQANRNVHDFATEAMILHNYNSTNYAQSGDPVDGYYPFDLTLDGDIFQVVMPGLPLEQVRYMGESGQERFDFPALTVDGNVALWNVALECCMPEEY